MDSKKSVVLVVLNNFKNDSRVLKEAKTLQKSGFDVKVVALHEEGLEEFDEVEGTKVHRIKLTSRKWPKKKIVQILKYFEFLYRFVRGYKNVDFYHCNDLNALPAGVLAKKFSSKDAKIIYDAHEYEINDTPNQSKISIKIKYFLERFFIKYANSTITVSDSIANEYAKMYGIKKPYLVLNTPFYKNIKKHDLFRDKFGIPQSEKIFLYQGGLGYGRGIEVLLESFSENGKTIVFMGYGPLEELVKEYGEKYKNIYYHEAVKPDVLLNYTSSADFGILFYENNCKNHDFCSPNKMFEYIMADLPIILSNLSEMKNLIAKYKIGVISDKNDKVELTKAAQKIEQLDIKELKQNLQKAREIFNWEEQEKVLKECYGVRN